MGISKKQKDLKPTLLKIAVYEGNELDLLVDLVAAIRPVRRIFKKELPPNLDNLIQYLQTEESLRIGLKNYIKRVFSDLPLSSSLTDANIITGINFWSELRKRLVNKILPIQPEKGTIEHLLVNVFYLQRDGEWVCQIEDEVGKQLLILLEIDGLFERDIDSLFFQDILFSIRVITHRITGNAFEVEVLRMAPQYVHKESPFAALQDEIDTFLKGIQSRGLSRNKEELCYKQIQVLIEQCRLFIEAAYKNKSKFGISFEVHQQLMVMETLLRRLNIILEFIIQEENEDSKIELIKLMKTLVRINSGKSQISDYLNQSTQLMAHEITQNTGKAGEHYITSNISEYKEMLVSAIGGGAIVAFACVVKMELAEVPSSLFGQGLLYSLNYVITFIGIYLMHYTLATKQPAMTAATLAQVIESDLKAKNNFENLSRVFSRIFRSQFIAFVGNVLMAFPVAMALMFLWGFLFDVNLAAHKAPVLIKDLNLFKSHLVFHSAIAGVFLFLSGLIAGSVHNKTKYRRVPERIREHPILKRTMSKENRLKLANFYENNMGGIASNFWFGIFLGFTHTVGIILGFDLDIRHITFAAGNFALGLYGLQFNLSLQTILLAIAGIGIIGFVNFIVSFSLSFGLALRSRGVQVHTFGSIFRAIKNRFFQHPLSFFFPPKEKASNS